MCDRRQGDREYPHVWRGHGSNFLLGRVQVFICGWVGKSRRSILAMDYKSQSALLVVSPTLPRHADNRPETILTGSEWG
jgi:hypothetical protein